MQQSKQNLGPWSTSLDAGMRLQLSAFWKRRMTSLTYLPSQSAKLSSRCMAAALCTAVLLAATPLVYFSPVAKGADKPEAAEKGDELQKVVAGAEGAGAKPQAAGGGEPFVARFSNGVEVELIGLSVNPSKDQPWWRPDGSPLAERPYADVRARMGSGLPREICFRWKNLPKDPDYTLSWNTVPAYEAAGGAPFDAKGKRIEGLWATAVGLTESPESCTVQFSTSVSATPWKTVFSDDGRHYSSMGSSVGGKPRSVIWSPARKEDDELLITVSFKAAGESVRLVAIDESEQQHAAVRVYGGGASDFMQQTFAFDELPLEAIDRFELQTQTREIETIEFANVSLEAGKLTKVATRPVKADDNPLKR